MLRKIFHIFMFIGICTIIVTQVHSLFKMTNIHCESFNKSWVYVNNCRLHAVRRGIAPLNLNITLKAPAYVVDANFDFVQKANGYKPFVINTTFDCCKFMATKSQPVAKFVYNFFEEFTNINHTCPFMGDQIIDGFFPRHELMNLPWPNGEFGLLITWYLHKQKTFVTDVYFEFQAENKLVG